MNRKGQAMIIDALFFLMLCGMSAAILAWASSVYGNQALDAYRNLYLIDMESSTIQVLGGTSYSYEGNELFWMDQFGRYLAGQFNETDDRFKLLLDKWREICNTSGNPIEIEILPEGKTSVCYKGNNKNSEVCAGSYSGERHMLILTCPIQKGGKRTSSFEEVLNYTTCGGVEVCSNGGGSCDYLDLGAKAGEKYKHMLILEIEKPDTGNCEGGIRPEPPYYASPRLAKMCHNFICDMAAKVYY